MNIPTIASFTSYFYPAKVEQAPVVAEQVPVVTEQAPVVTEQAPVATASQSSKLVENGGRALLIGVSGVAMCAVALATGNGQAWEKVSEQVAAAVLAVTAGGVISQGKDVVDVVVDSSVAGVKTGVNYVAGGLSYASNVTGVTALWNTTYASALKPAYDFAASLNPYAKKV